MNNIENIRKLIESEKSEIIKKAKEIVKMIDALREIHAADIILQDSEFQKSVTAMGVPDPAVNPATKTKRTRRPMSAAAKAKISAAAKKRWAKRKKKDKKPH